MYSDEDITANEPIEKDKAMSEIRPDPYTLPQGFVWDTLVLDNQQTVGLLTHIFLLKIDPPKTFLIFYSCKNSINFWTKTTSRTTTTCFDSIIRPIFCCGISLPAVIMSGSRFQLLFAGL